MPLSLDVLRVGKKYHLRNYSDKINFQVEATTGDGDFHIKDLDTLEKYKLSEFLKYGKSKDYDLYEIEA